MLQTVDVETQPVEAYEPMIGAEAVQELLELGEALRGARVVHLNAITRLVADELRLFRDLA